MVDVFGTLAMILLTTGVLGASLFFKINKKAAGAVFVVIAVLGVATMIFSFIPNEFSTGVITNAVERKYDDWDKQISVVTDKRDEKTTKIVRRNKRNRKETKHTYYVTVNSNIVTDATSEEEKRITQSVTNPDGETVSVILDENQPIGNTFKVKSSIYNHVSRGQIVLTATKNGMFGTKTEIILPEYTPESWKETYGIK